jgi:hypothetical protein
VQLVAEACYAAGQNLALACTPKAVYHATFVKWQCF